MNAVLEIIEQDVELVEIITAGPQGQQGIQGPIGTPGQNYVTKIAGENLGGQRFVIGNSNETVTYANQSDLTNLGKVIGITLTSASMGENVDVLLFGFIEFNGWSFDVSLPVYLNNNGLLTQTPPSTGFSQIVGFAETPTSLFVSLREPIILGA